MLNKKSAIKLLATLILAAPFSQAMEQQVEKTHPWFTKPHVPEFYGQSLTLKNNRNSLNIPAYLVKSSSLLSDIYNGRKENAAITISLRYSLQGSPYSKKDGSFSSKELACTYHLLNATHKLLHNECSLKDVINQLIDMDENELKVVQSLIQELDIKLPGYIDLFFTVQSILNKKDELSSEAGFKQALEQINMEIKKAVSSTGLFGKCFVCHEPYPANDFIKTSCKNPETDKSFGLHSYCYQQWLENNENRCPACEQENCKAKKKNLIEKWVCKLIIDHDQDYFLALLPSCERKRIVNPKLFNPDDTRPNKAISAKQLLKYKNKPEKNLHLLIAIYNSETKLSFPILGGLENDITGYSFSPDGKKLLSFSRYGTANIWNLKNEVPSKPLQPFFSLPIKKSDECKVVHLASWHPSGKYIAILDPEYDIVIYNIENKKIIKKIKYEALRAPSSIYFDEDGNLITQDSYNSYQFDMNLPKLSAKQLLYLLMLENSKNNQDQFHTSLYFTKIHKSLRDINQNFYKNITAHYSKLIVKFIDNIEEFKFARTDSQNILQGRIKELCNDDSAYENLYNTIQNICGSKEVLYQEEELKSAIEQLNQAIEIATIATKPIGICLTCQQEVPAHDYVEPSCIEALLHPACYQSWLENNENKCPGCEQEKCLGLERNLIEEWAAERILENEQDYFLALLPSYERKRVNNPKLFNPDDTRPNKTISAMHLVNYKKKPIAIYNSETKLSFPFLIGHDKKIAGSSFSPDGKKLLSFSSDDCTANIWELKNQDSSKPLQPFFSVPIREFNTDEVNLACWHPSGKYIAVSHPKDKIAIYNIEKKKIIKEIITNGLTIPWKVYFSEDGNLITRDKNDNNIQQYDMQLPKLSAKQLLYLLALEKLQHIKNPQIKTSQLHTDIHISLNNVPSQDDFLGKISNIYKNYLLELLDNS